MDVRVFAVVLALAAFPASAQQIYKCVQGKQTVYQSDPCPGQAVKAWDATPEPYDPRKAAQVEAARRQVQASNAPRPTYGSSGPSGTRVTIARDPSTCEHEKAARASAYAAAGTRRTFKMSSYWDNRVQQACK